GPRGGGAGGGSGGGRWGREGRGRVKVCRGARRVSRVAVHGQATMGDGGALARLASMEARMRAARAWSVMTARTRTVPPQRAHREMSTSNVRLNKVAHGTRGVAACRG